MGKKNIGATLTLKDGNFFAGIRKAITGTNQFKTHTAGATSQLKKMDIQGNLTGNSLANLAKKVTGVAAAYMGLSKIKDALQFGDTLVQNDARLNLMNDGLQSTSELNDKIFQSAMRARGGYLETSQAIAKMGILAGGAFKNNDEITSFTELMNKAFKVGGSSAEEQKNATYQLTQAMAAGKLQGDEFRSIMENAPMLADAIANQMKIPKGQLKEMSRDGIITADVIKNAMFGASQQINKQFDTMPVTFGDRMEKWKNIGIQKVKPFMTYVNNSVLPTLETSIVKGVNFIMPYIDKLNPVFKSVWDFGVSTFNSIKDSIEQNSPTIQNISSIIGIMGKNLFDTFELLKPAINWVKDIGLPLVIDVLAGVLKAARDVNDFFVNNWSGLQWIIIPIVSALGAYKFAVMAVDAWQWLCVASTNAWAFAQGVWNAVMAVSPMGWVILGIGALIGVGILLWKNWAKITEFFKWAWNGIKEWAVSAFNGLCNFFVAYWPYILGVFTGGIGLIVGLIIQNWDSVKSTTINIFNNIKDTVINIWNGIWSGIKGIINLIISGINGMIIGFVNGINGLASGVNAVSSAIGIPAIPTITAPQIPMLAKGGIIRHSGTVLVGEKGPELLNLNAGAKVTPLDKKNTSVVINMHNTFSGTSLTVDDVVEQLVPKLKLALSNI